MRTLIIGLDAFDPNLFEQLSEKGKLPNLVKLAELGGYSRFQVSNPPQSEVSWTSIATGLNPGEHGMFDFVHRDPGSYGLEVSLLPTSKVMGTLQFVRPYNAYTIFDHAAERGFPSISLWWPATFPARPESPVRTLPGLGTPDIQGRMGVGSFYSSEGNLPEKHGKTPLFPLKKVSGNLYTGELEGPRVKEKEGMANLKLPLEIKVKNSETVALRLDKQVYQLRKDEWSPILEVQFKAGFLTSVYAITRIIITGLDPVVEFYVLPLQIHPLHPLWRYGTPASFVNNAWSSSGPFLTLGWPQDTTGLEDGCISDAAFLKLCDEIFYAREKLLFHELDHFKEGLLASVFDSLDRIQHMFLLRRPDVIESWYARYDQLVGKAMERLVTMPGEKTRLLVVSDHGFYRLDYKVHTNRWLIENDYLVMKEGVNSHDLKAIDWQKTKAYAVGLNSLYLNLQGREKQGTVTAEEKESLLTQLQQDLLNWASPESRSVVLNAWKNADVFSGAFAVNGPDMLIGYAPGFRGSAETGLGGWKESALEINNDHWEADHCFDAAGVPGVLFSSQKLDKYPHPSYRDIPALAVDSAPKTGGAGPAPKLASEDQEKVEERLKSLGYL
jgi:predicted AlkP superfamily phosphohydrolase/phosphomutase